MIVRVTSIVSTGALLFAFAFFPTHVAAQDADLDGTLDALDPCPHVALATPALMSAPQIEFRYGNTGPGGGDDRVKLHKNGAFFTTLALFDPDTVDNVHVTLRRTTTTGADLWAVSLPAGPPWTQRQISRRGHQQWNYKAPAAGVGYFKGLLRNALVAPYLSGLNRLTVVKAENTNIAGPLGTDDIVSILEIENGFAGLCFAATSATCTSSPNDDRCLP